MSDTYRRGAHTVFEIHLHLVWVTKYRRAALSGEVGTRVRELIREICAQEGVVIIKGQVVASDVRRVRYGIGAHLCERRALVRASPSWSS
jgi:hypothetical protein